MRRVLIVVLVVATAVGIAFAQSGVKKKRALPHDFGKVVINNYSEKAGLAPVQFDHWLHRAKFTCRLCHVDLTFAMKAGTTGVKAADNAKGFYCGACHNGKSVYGGKTVFASCEKNAPAEARGRCERCHSVGKQVKREYDFYTFTAELPKERFGNGINWEKAEADGLIKPVDFIEGISIKRPPLKIQKDFTIESKIEGMSDIIFSHKKHTVWNGCELCHPELFYGIKKGVTKYSMSDIFQGKYCGACHVNVAFPLIDCQRCHMKPVEQ